MTCPVLKLAIACPPAAVHENPTLLIPATTFTPPEAVPGTWTPSIRSHFRLLLPTWAVLTLRPINKATEKIPAIMASFDDLIRILLSKNPALTLPIWLVDIERSPWTVGKG